MTERICPACGSDIWRAAGYDELREARDRHWQKNREQAIEILRLQLRVAELEEWRRTRNRKIERQRRTIRRMEEKIVAAGIRPHDDRRPGEGDAASPHPAVSPEPPSEKDPGPPSTRAMRKLRRAAENESATS